VDRLSGKAWRIESWRGVERGDEGSQAEVRVVSGGSSNVHQWSLRAGVALISVGVCEA
jgi:hypothetical protein